MLDPATTNCAIAAHRQFLMESTNSLFSPVECGKSAASAPLMAVEQIVIWAAFCLAWCSSASITARSSWGCKFALLAASDTEGSGACDDFPAPDALLAGISTPFVGMTSTNRGCAEAVVRFSGATTVLWEVSAGSEARSASSVMEETHLGFARVLNFSTVVSTISTSGTLLSFAWSAAAMALIF